MTEFSPPSLLIVVLFTFASTIFCVLLLLERRAWSVVPDRTCPMTPVRTRSGDKRL